MTLVFVGGVMNVSSRIAIAIFDRLERTLAFPLPSRLAGLVFISFGI